MRQYLTPHSADLLRRRPQLSDHQHDAHEPRAGLDSILQRLAAGGPCASDLDVERRPADDDFAAARRPPRYNHHLLRRLVSLHHNTQQPDEQLLYCLLPYARRHQGDWQLVRLVRAGQSDEWQPVRVRPELLGGLCVQLLLDRLHPPHVASSMFSPPVMGRIN